jgi:hypothetical protein
MGFNSVFKGLSQRLLLKHKHEHSLHLRYERDIIQDFHLRLCQTLHGTARAVIAVVVMTVVAAIITVAKSPSPSTLKSLPILPPVSHTDNFNL